MKQRAFLAIGTIVLCAGLLAGCGKITKSVEINYGETYKIEDEKLEGKENLTWESADAEIVEVADDGTVTAKAPGKAKVAIKENGKSVGEYELFKLLNDTAIDRILVFHHHGIKIERTKNI